MGKKEAPPPVELPLWLQMDKVSHRYLAALSVRLGHLGIQRHYFLLQVIGNGQGKLTQQALADILEIDKVSMVGILDYLVDCGFAVRKVGKRDRRERRISLTPKGVKALPEIGRGIAELNRRALGALPAGLAEKFSGSLGSLKNALQIAEREYLDEVEKKRQKRFSNAR